MKNFRRKGFALSFLLLLFQILTVSAGSTRHDQTNAANIAAGDNDHLETYIIQLSDASVASYRGGIAGLAPTNPAARGERTLRHSTATAAYRTYLENEQTQFTARMTQAVGRRPTILSTYQHALNGMSVELTAAEATLIANLPGVQAVTIETIAHIVTDASPDWLGASALWDGSATGGLPGTQGEETVIAVLDTGINHDHPSFADIGGDGYDHTNPLGSGNYIPGSYCDANVPGSNPAFCNDKLIGAWSFTSDTGSPEDGHSHGSHTASTAAGNVLSATISAPTISFTRQIAGMAPHANLVIYDVCNDGGGCGLSARTSAIEQVIIDSMSLPNGITALNYSISGSGGPYFGTIQQLFLSAADAGIFVAAAAANEGPNAGTVQHLSPWVTTVGNSLHNQFRRNTSLIDMNGGSTEPPENMYGIGVSLTAGHGPARIVYAGDLGPDSNALCGTGSAGSGNSSPWPAGFFNGEIVVCDGGTYGPIEKGENLLFSGAGGYILIDNNTNPFSQRHVLPTVHISQADGTALKDWLQDGGSDHTAVITSFENVDIGAGDTMHASSGRGPNPTLDILKPDVAAPGFGIWAAVHTNGVMPAPEYDFQTGTSMASPHVAGAAALLSALHPDWSPHEIKSALMTTALTSVRKSYEGPGAGPPADPFDMGAGRVDLSVAALAGFVLDESTANFEAANPSLGGDPTTLNIPSMQDGTCTPGCSWTRRMTSTQAVAVVWSVSVAAPAGITIEVFPDSFTLQPGSTQVIDVTAVFSGAAPDEWFFAEILLTPDSVEIPQAHFPVAIKRLSLDRYVAPNGADSGSCAVQTSPCQTIAYALTQANGDTVHIAAGTYLENITIDKSVTLQGAGQGMTIIDGNASDTVVTIGAAQTIHVTLADLTITNGAGSTGGGILNSPQAVTNSLTTLNRVTVSNNDATDGGGIFNGLDGALSLNNSTVSNNTAACGFCDGGGIYNAGGLVTVTSSVVSGNGISVNGGGIYNEGELELYDSVVSKNVAIFGGGIQNFGSNATTTLIRSIVEGGDPTGDAIFGGGIYNELGMVTLTDSSVHTLNATGYGGGIYNFKGGSITLNRSVVTHVSRGGGIYNESSTLRLVNSTVSDNSGLGIWNISFSENAVTQLINSTVSNNTAQNITAGGIQNDFGSVTLTNTIVANQTSGADCAGVVTSNGYNLDSDGSCVGTASDQTADPLLGPLQNNGGPTETHALLPGSPAIDAGDNSTCPDVDQRGEPRPADGDGDSTAVCDIGAFEHQPPIAADTTAPSCQVVVTPGVPTEILLTIQDTGSGLAQIDIVRQQNVSLNVPSFTVGTTEPLVVTATVRVSRGLAAVGLEISDVAGNMTACGRQLRFRR